MKSKSSPRCFIGCPRALVFVFSVLLLVLTDPARAEAPNPAPEEPSAFSGWWNGKYMTGNWFGVRDTFADRGLTFNGKYYGAFFGVVDSQDGARGFWDEGIEF